MGLIGPMAHHVRNIQETPPNRRRRYHRQSPRRRRAWAALGHGRSAMVGPLTTIFAGVTLALGQAVAPSAPPAEETPIAAPAPLDPVTVPGEEPINPRFYFSAEYLVWWLRNTSAPITVTTGPATGTPPGGFGQNTKKALFDGTH